MNFTKTRSDFISEKIRCAADLYLPTSVNKPPIVIMAHGLGAERSFGLPAYAEYFANEGMAVLLFDYRCFGDSDGEPRQLVNPTHHLQDWRAAIQHTYLISNLDTSRIALWGSSYSGGHVVVTAEKEPKISPGTIATLFSFIIFIEKSKPDILNGFTDGII